MQAVNISPLQVSQPDSKMATMIVDSAPGAICTIGEIGRRHEITAFVIEGTVELNFSRSQEVLEAGDCVVLNSSAPVVWSSKGTSGYKALIAMIREG